MEHSGGTQQVSQQEVASRMNELFPDESDGDTVPDAGSVTSILDQILPQDDSANVGGSSGANVSPGNVGGAALTSAHYNAASISPGSGVFRNPTADDPQGGGWSVFLAKIADPNRREKAVPLLAELSGISEEEATALSKKVIIPVLRGVSKEDAERAKHRFAEIGVLARVRNS